MLDWIFIVIIAAAFVAAIINWRKSGCCGNCTACQNCRKQKK